MTYNHPSVFITKGEYEKHLYNTELRALSDYKFVLEVFLRDKETLFYVNQAMVNYRLGGISTQMLLLDSLKEGYMAIHNAGMVLYENVLSIFIRSTIIFLNRLRNMK